jgi:hypothetical protein
VAARHLGGAEDELVEAPIDREVARGNHDDGARHSNERGDSELQQIRVAVAQQHLLEPRNHTGGTANASAALVCSSTA